MFFPPRSDHDAYIEIRKILQRAKERLRIVDPYLDNTIFYIFADIQSPLIIELLVGNPPSDFVQESQKFIKQNSFMTVEIRRTRDFHDRFIVIDHAECWHLGASIKDAGRKALMLNAIEDRKTTEASLQTIDTTWDKATSIQ